MKSFSFFGHFPLDVRVVAEGHHVVVVVVVSAAVACLPLVSFANVVVAASCVFCSLVFFTLQH